MHHFIIGGNKSFFMASSNGDCKIIGSLKKNIADNRASITAYRTGTVGGETGPTIMLLAGKRKKAG